MACQASTKAFVGCNVILLITFCKVSAFPARQLLHQPSIDHQIVRPKALSMSGLFGEAQGIQRRKNISDTLEWQIYVDQSKPSLERGASATLDAFCGLAPPDKVQIIPAILPKTKNRFPWVRCMSTKVAITSVDVGNVDSVDKVYRVLTKHLKVENVSAEICDCLRWKYKGNSFLEQGNLDQAIDAYNQALSKSFAKSGSVGKKQEGLILLLRASAFLQRAQAQKAILTKITQEWEIPNLQDQQTLIMEAFSNGGLAMANSVLNRIQKDGQKQKQIMRQIQYNHGLYQYALLRAAKDALRATEILPTYPPSFLRAAEVLNELWNLGESRRYLERALALDDSLKIPVKRLSEVLERRQQILDSARANKEWSDDSLRLALDIAA